MFVVVAYDVPDDRRRAHLHKKLKNYGTPVQYSVFEGNLNGAQLRRMRETVLQIIDAEEDRVRIYVLCRSCHGRAEAINGEVSDDASSIVV